MKWSWIITLLCLIGTAALVILFQSQSLPKDLTRDEVEFARLAVKLSNQPYTPYDEYATGHTTLYFYIILASFQLLGLSQFALRFPSALFGFINVFALYVLYSMIFQKGILRVKIPILKKLTNIETALLLSFLFVTTRWYFNFARFSFEATFIIFLEIISLIFLMMFEKRKNILLLILSAVCAGFAYNSYQPGRFFIFIPLLYMFLKPSLKKWRNFLLYTIVFGFIITPISLYLAQHPDIRLYQQLYFLDPNLTIIQKMLFLAENALRMVQMFTIKGDVNGLHNYPLKPALNPIMLTLFLAGLIYGLKKRNATSNVFLAYLVLALFPTLLTYPHENPNMLRTVTALPSIIYFCGLGIAHILEAGSRVKRKFSFLAYIPLCIVALVVISATFDIYTYFRYQSTVMNESFEVKDGFAGVYTFMHARKIPISKFRISETDMRLYRKLSP